MSSIVCYRIKQFWQSFQHLPGEDEIESIKEFLSTRELDIFKELMAQDQNHSLRVLNTLLDTGEGDIDLLKAALLHDVGKITQPLNRWDRILAVLVAGILPGKYQEWSRAEPTRLNRALVVIKKHPGWGAGLLEAAGSSPKTIWLVQYHEDLEPAGDYSEQDLILLRKLQKADNQN